MVAAAAPKAIHSVILLGVPPNKFVDPALRELSEET